MDDDDIDNLFSFGNSPSRPVQTLSAKDGGNDDDDDIFGDTGAPSSPPPSTKTMPLSPSSAEKEFLGLLGGDTPTKNRGGGGVGGIVPPMPSVSSPSSPKVSAVGGGGATASVPAMPSPGGGVRGGGSRSPRSPRGGRGGGGGTNKQRLNSEDFHVHDSGTRDFLDWLDGDSGAAGAGGGESQKGGPAPPGTTIAGGGGAAAASPVAKVVAPRAPQLQPTDGDGGGASASSGGFHLLPRRVDSESGTPTTEKDGVMAVPEDREEGGESGVVEVIESSDSFDFDKEIWDGGGGSNKKKASHTSDGVNSSNNNKGTRRSSSPSSDGGSGSGSSGGGGKYFTLVSADDEEEDEGDSKKKKEKSDSQSSSISSFEEVPAVSSTPSQRQQRRQISDGADEIIFTTESVDSSDTPTATNAPQQQKRQSQSTSRGGEDEFLAIIPTEEHEQGGAANTSTSGSSPKDAATRRPTIATLTFSSLEQCLTSSHSTPDQIRKYLLQHRHMYHTGYVEGPTGGHWNLDGGASRGARRGGNRSDNRRNLYVKLICGGRTYEEVSNSSLAYSYESWLKEEEERKRSRLCGVGDSEGAEADTSNVVDDDEAHWLTLDLFPSSGNDQDGNGEEEGESEEAEKERMEFESNLRDLLKYFANQHAATTNHQSGAPPPFLPTITAVILHAVHSPPVASVVLSKLLSSHLPLMSLEESEQMQAARLLHKQFYLLCMYHAPMVVLHLDRYLPGWYWPQKKEEGDDDDGRRDGGGGGDEGVGGGKVASGVVTTSANAEGETSAKGDDDDEEQQRGNNYRDLERNGLFPLSWFVGCFAGHCAQKQQPSSDDTTNNGGSGPATTASASQQQQGRKTQWVQGLPPRYLTHLWDVLLIESSDDPGRKFFLGVAVLEKHSQDILLLREKEALEKLVNDMANSCLVDTVSKFGAAAKDEEYDSEFDTSGADGMEATVATAETEVGRDQTSSSSVIEQVSEWCRASHDLKDFTPRSVLDKLRTVDDTLVRSTIMVRNRKKTREIEVQLREEAKAHRVAAEIKMKEQEERDRIEKEAVIRERLSEYYMFHNPEKADEASIDKIMEVYKGRWHVLDERLRKKYGTGFQPETAGNVAADHGGSSAGGDDGGVGADVSSSSATSTIPSLAKAYVDPNKTNKLLATMNQGFAMAKRIDLAAAQKLQHLQKREQRVGSDSDVTSLPSSPGRSSSMDEEEDEMEAELNQEQVAVLVKAEEVLPILCTKHGEKPADVLASPLSSFAPVTVEDTTSGTSRLVPLHFFLVDSRPKDPTMTQGRFPTALHVSPEALLDPDMIQSELDMVESLRGSVHICVMGEGIGAIPRLYDHPLSELQQAAAKEDDSRTSICALFFIKMGFPFVSVLDGGFAAAHSWLVRDGPSYSLPTAKELLVDYDDYQSSFAKLERAYKLRLQGISPKVQELLESSIATIAVTHAKIGKFAANNLDEKGRQRMKQSVTKTLQDTSARIQKRRSDGNAGAGGEMESSSGADKTKTPVDQNPDDAPSPLSDDSTQRKNPFLGLGKQIAAQREALASRTLAAASEGETKDGNNEAGANSSETQPPPSATDGTSPKRNPFSGLSKHLAAQREALAVRNAAVAAAAAKEGKSEEEAKQDASPLDDPLQRSTSGGDSPRKNPFAGLGKQIAAQREALASRAASSDEGEGKKEGDDSNPILPPSTWKLVGGLGAKLKSRSQDEEDGANAEKGGERAAAKETQLLTSSVLKMNPFAGFGNKSQQDSSAEVGGGTSVDVRSDTDATAESSSVGESASSAEGSSAPPPSASVANVLKRNPFAGLANKVPRGGGGDGEAQQPRFKGTVDALKVNTFGRFGRPNPSGSSSGPTFSPSEEAIFFGDEFDDTAAASADTSNLIAGSGSSDDLALSEEPIAEKDPGTAGTASVPTMFPIQAPKSSVTDATIPGAFDLGVLNFDGDKKLERQTSTASAGSDVSATFDPSVISFGLGGGSGKK